MFVLTFTISAIPRPLPPRKHHIPLLRLTADENEICLLVEDTGIGIPEADIPQIFSRFYRVDKQRSRETGGSGLGLSIVRDTLKRLGGRIEVSSKENEGTRFTVFFPRHSL
jgi:signal transduction histidine kinase